MTRKVTHDKHRPRRNSYRATQEKKAGGGQHNWGTIQDELEDWDVELGKTYPSDSPVMKKVEELASDEREEHSNRSK